MTFRPLRCNVVYGLGSISNWSALESSPVCEPIFGIITNNEIGMRMVVEPHEMRNWKIISNGDDFESLVGSLLMAEILGIVVFGRSGPNLRKVE